MYTFPKTATVEEVAAKWKEELEISQSTRFLNEEGIPVSEEQQLKDIPQQLPGLLRFFYEEEVSITIEVFGGTDSAQQLQVWPSQTLEEVIPHINQIIAPELNLSAARFWCDEELLTMDSKMSSLTAERQTVVLELKPDIYFLDVWDKACVTFEDVRYTDNSEHLRRTLQEAFHDQKKKQEEEGLEDETDDEGEDEGGEGREVEEDSDKDDMTEEKVQQLVHLQLDNSHIFFVGILLDILKHFGAPWRQLYEFIINATRSIYVLSNQGLQQRVIEIGDVIGDISKSPALQGEGISPSDTLLSDLNIAEDGILVTDPITIPIQLSDGFYVSPRISKFATVTDLRRIVSNFENDTEIDLILGHRKLDNDDEMVGTIFNISNSVVQVEKRQKMTINVVINEQKISWETLQQRISYTDVLARFRTDINKELDEEFCDIDFHCMGCGRKISHEEESFQSIPANCCSKQSKELEIRTPPSTKSKKYRTVLMNLT